MACWWNLQKWVRERESRAAMAAVPESVATLCSTNCSLSAKNREKAYHQSRKIKGKDEMDVYNEESEILAENTFTSTGGWTLNGQLLCCRNTYCAILCIKECLVDVDKLLRILATLSIVYENCHDMEFVTLYIKAGT